MRSWSVLPVIGLAACAFDGTGVAGGDGGGPIDAAVTVDGRTVTPDAGGDGSVIDAAPVDAAPIDAMPIDAMPIDAMPIDAMPIDAMTPPCPTGYAPSGAAGNPHFYRFVDSNTSAANALADCGDDRAGRTYVAVIDDDAENALIDTLAGNRAVWLGLSDEAVEGTWITVLGTTQTYFQWDSNQPDNFGIGGEQCVEQKTNAKWNDLGCTSNRRYVCECDPALPVTP